MQQDHPGPVLWRDIPVQNSQRILRNACYLCWTLARDPDPSTLLHATVCFFSNGNDPGFFLSPRGAKYITYHPLSPFSFRLISKLIDIYIALSSEPTFNSREPWYLMYIRTVCTYIHTPGVLRRWLYYHPTSAKWYSRHLFSVSIVFGYEVSCSLVSSRLVSPIRSHDAATCSRQMSVVPRVICVQGCRGLMPARSRCELVKLVWGKNCW